MIRRRFAASSICAVLLVLAGLSGLLLESARRDAGIVPSAARIPLGAFEALFVDLLYLRADRYVKENRRTEAVAAIRIITELQPRVPENWALLGSLLAWRIPGKTADHEAQWRCTREGIEVIERGLVLNPESPVLLEALGVLYLNWIGENPGLRDVAEDALGRPPSALAAEAFGRLRATGRSNFAIFGYAKASLELGRTLLERGDSEAALRALRAARDACAEIAQDPEHAAVYLKTVEALDLQIGDLEGR